MQTLIERLELPADGFAIPCILMTPPNPSGAVVVSHGYGGNKEEQLGLAWRVADSGFVACVIDLRGHGEHPLPLDDGIQADMDSAVEFCRKFGKVAAMGHSLGGRLALHSNADFALAISPALGSSFGEQTVGILNNFRSYRVSESAPGVLYSIFPKLPEWHWNGCRPTAIVYATRDAVEIVQACKAIETTGDIPVIEINQAMHSDIFTLEATFDCVTNQLREWFAE